MLQPIGYEQLNDQREILFVVNAWRSSNLITKEAYMKKGIYILLVIWQNCHSATSNKPSGNLDDKLFASRWCPMVLMAFSRTSLAADFGAFLSHSVTTSWRHTEELKPSLMLSKFPTLSCIPKSFHLAATGVKSATKRSSPACKKWYLGQETY